MSTRVRLHRRKVDTWRWHLTTPVSKAFGMVGFVVALVLVMSWQYPNIERLLGEVTAFTTGDARQAELADTLATAREAIRDAGQDADTSALVQRLDECSRANAPVRECIRDVQALTEALSAP